MTNAIPFVDLQAQYQSIREEMDAAVRSVIEETAFIGGPRLQAFEKAFASYCGVAHAVGVSNGTDAIRLALLGCGIGPGDEVITVPNTFIGTTEAITMTGAQIRFVDVDPASLNMDPSLLEKAVTGKTKAVVPVHLYGRPADMGPILDIAKKHGLKVVGDAAQAHGSEYKGKKIASLGDAVAFSFYPGKNLGAYGDAGAVATNDPEIARKVAALRDHGRAQKYEHDMEGFNCRMDALQAAVLNVKLRHIGRWTELRRRNAALYREHLSGIPGLTLPAEDGNAAPVHHLYVVQSGDRDGLQKHLQARGISTGIHYPIPLHRQKAYARLNHAEGSFPVTEGAARHILSLPIFPELTEAQIRQVAEQIRKFT